MRAPNKPIKIALKPFNISQGFFQFSNKMLHSTGFCAKHFFSKSGNLKKVENALEFQALIN